MIRKAIQLLNAYVAIEKTFVNDYQIYWFISEFLGIAYNDENEIWLDMLAYDLHGLTTSNREFLYSDGELFYFLKTLIYVMPLFKR